MPDKEEGDDKKSTKDVVNKKQKQMMGEEGYDVARDMGRVKPSKDKKDATTMPVSDEVKKTQKVNKGPSALERVKANIEKKYGKGAIMNVKKEELDLTKVAESFNGNIVEVQRIGDNYKEIIARMKSGQPLSGSDLMGGGNKPKVTQGRGRVKTKVTSGIDDPTSGYDLKQMSVDDQIKYQEIKKEVEASRNKKPKPPKKRNLFPKAGDPNTPEVKRVQAKIDAKNPTYRSSVTGNKLPVRRKDVRAAVQGGVKSPVQAIKKVTSAVPKQTQVVKNVAKKLTVGGKNIGKTVGKAAAGGLAKRSLGRAGGKLLAKQIPGIGTVISGGEAIARFASGDVVGGALSAAEMIPGLGLAAGAANFARDVGRTRRAVKTIKQIKPLSKGMKLLQKSKTGRTLSKMQRTARRNPLATVGGAVVGTGVGTNVATGGGRGKLPRIPKPKLDQGVVGRRTAG